MSADLPTLMALRVQGVAKPDRLAAALGVSATDATERARSLVEKGLAEKSFGSVRGWSLTDAGHEALEVDLSEEGKRSDAALIPLYRRFLEQNPAVLRAASDWQVRRYGGAEISNDHSDLAYDESVIRRLRQTHDRASGTLRELGKHLPRLLPYRNRLHSCIERLQSGDQRALTGLLEESYHTVWYELHQDLLLTLGLERTE